MLPSKRSTCFLAHICHAHMQPGGYFQHTAALAELVRSHERRAEELDPLLKAFMFVIPQACSPTHLQACRVVSCSCFPSAQSAFRCLQATCCA